MDYAKVVCYDLEMCCWDERTSRIGEIIEVGVAEIDLRKQKITRRAQYYVKPEKDRVSDFCTELTGITQRVVDKQGRPLSDVLKTVVKNFGGSQKIYGSWGRDDLVIFNECNAKGIEQPFKEHLNIAMLYRMQGRVKNKRCSMLKAMENEAIEFEGRQHSGYVDAYNLAKLSLKIL